MLAGHLRWRSRTLWRRRGREPLSSPHACRGLGLPWRPRCTRWSPRSSSGSLATRLLGCLSFVASCAVPAATAKLAHCFGCRRPVGATWTKAVRSGRGPRLSGAGDVVLEHLCAARSPQPAARSASSCSVGGVGTPGRWWAAIQPQRDQRRIAAGQGRVGRSRYAGTGDRRVAGNGLIEHGGLAVGRRLRRVPDKGHYPALTPRGPSLQCRDKFRHQGQAAAGQAGAVDKDEDRTSADPQQGPNINDLSLRAVLSGRVACRHRSAPCG